MSLRYRILGEGMFAMIHMHIGSANPYFLDPDERFAGLDLGDGYLHEFNYSRGCHHLLKHWFFLRYDFTDTYSRHPQ